MSGHTPGPWTYKRDSDYWSIAPTEIGGKDNYEGNEADYRLIAAAPELLAFISGIAEQPLSGDEAGPDADLDRIIRKARALISKATSKP